MRCEPRPGCSAPWPGDGSWPPALPERPPAAYADALDRQIRDFPKDPATDEARWLLGSLARASGETAKAEALWQDIAAGSPRWLDAALARAELERAALESLLATGDRHLMSESYQRAMAHLTESLKRASGELEQAELRLTEARLNLVPAGGQALACRGHPQWAGEVEPRAPEPLPGTGSTALIALVQVGPPYLESEREAQTHATWADPSAQPAFFDAIRLIDECATYSEVDLRQRRLGLVLRLLVQPATPGGRCRPMDARGAGRAQAEAHARLPVPGRRGERAGLVPRLVRPSPVRRR